MTEIEWTTQMLGLGTLVITPQKIWACKFLSCIECHRNIMKSIVRSVKIAQIEDSKVFWRMSNTHSIYREITKQISVKNEQEARASCKSKLLWMMLCSTWCKWSLCLTKVQREMTCQLNVTHQEDAQRKTQSWGKQGAEIHLWCNFLHN